MVVCIIMCRSTRGARIQLLAPEFSANREDGDDYLRKMLEAVRDVLSLQPALRRQSQGGAAAAQVHLRMREVVSRCGGHEQAQGGEARRGSG